MDKRKAQKPSIVIRVLKAPGRVVSKIREKYISSMHLCAAGMGGPSVPYASSLPKSHSTASSRAEQDFAELIRISSIQKRNGLDSGFQGRQQTVAPRSHSVAIGRIDEEKSYDYGDDLRLNSMYPRSKSHAV